jgi:hypothetical protein
MQTFIFTWISPPQPAIKVANPTYPQNENTCVPVKNLYPQNANTCFYMKEPYAQNAKIHFYWKNHIRKMQTFIFTWKSTRTRRHHATKVAKRFSKA